MTPKDSRFKMSLPLQFLIYHQGGQIDTSNKKMIVSGNIATGITTELALRNKFFKSIGLSTYFVGYFDKLTNRELRPYRKGWGIYPVFTVDASPFKLMAGYWYSDKFYSFEGDPLFGSFNTMYPGNVLPTRSLATAKLSYSKQLHRSFSLGGQVETYYDIREKKLDYSFGILLRFNSKIFSKRL